MENWPRQFNMTKVTWTLGHSLTASLTLEIPVDSAHARIHQSTHLGLVRGLIHDFWMFDFGNRVRFLGRQNDRIFFKREKLNKKSYTHNFLGRKDTKLHFFNFADWGRRIGELMAEHGCYEGDNG